MDSHIVHPARDRRRRGERVHVVSRARTPSPPEFKTTPLKRGDITATISATGTVEPEQVIDVGAQVAGQILGFGKDLAGKTVDYGSHIDQSMVLANIDDATYKADVQSGQAQLAQSQSRRRSIRSGFGHRKSEARTGAARLGPRSKARKHRSPGAAGLRPVSSHLRNRQGRRRRRRRRDQPGASDRQPGRSNALAGAAEPGLLHDHQPGQRRHHRTGA